LAEGFANSKQTIKEDDKQYVIFLLAEKQLTAALIGRLHIHIQTKKGQNLMTQSLGMSSLNSIQGESKANTGCLHT
jgi:hypothetical protein